ncbi:hypothetical protein SAMN05421827_107121 [Pedobacter terrae]|uniref:Lipoprotein n=1 Tax=Pedobacter terrae TaxID=405671 RepID=A0A1G7UTW0_9SPHI|nr:hypothetical protein [Pedobacter terrae]SDG51045.1 hypothetical protein SAMN05421827_107121 [Pedobacter terrae]
MTKIGKYLLAVLSVLTYSCNNQQTTEKAVEVGRTDSTATAVIDTSNNLAPSVELPKVQQEEVHINYQDSIDFARYQIDAEKVTKYAPIDWTSYPEAKDFKTRITEAYKTNEIDFAGYYVVSVFGCGASCIMGFMVDVRDGKIYDLPLGEENSCLFAEDRAMGNLKSRLFIAGVCKENQDDKKVYYKAYLWDEDKKEFGKVEADAFLKNKLN